MMKKTVDKIYDSALPLREEASAGAKAAPGTERRKCRTVRAALVCLFVFTLICGIVYPVGVTVAAQALFPYEANGSRIIVTLSDGTERVYGSELIGQSFEDAKYLFGRVNTGAPSNLSPESEEFRKLLAERVALRREKLAAIGYTDEGEIPDQLLTSGGSGVDPHISPEAAYFQIPVVVAARNREAGPQGKIAEAEVRALIDRFTEGRFLGVFGERRVNVLLVNLALDGLV